jgi:hypothetical protein
MPLPARKPKGNREVKKDRKISISVSDDLADEQAVITGVDAIRDAAAVAGWDVVPAGNNADMAVEVSLHDGVVIAPMATATLPTIAEQSCRVQTTGQHVTRFEAGGVLGAAYGLAWIADGLRAGRDMPPKDQDRVPVFQQRIVHGGLARVKSDEPPYVDVERSRELIPDWARMLDQSVLSSATGIICGGTQDLVPWDDPKYGPRSEAYRELLTEYIQMAHARHIRVYASDDEFMYLPDWFEQTGATLSTDDPKLWEAMKSKYRALLPLMPTLDGIQTRIGEANPRDGIMAWDVIHTGEDRSIQGNYRRFIKAMHDVVVGEFDRQYIHRTWVVNTWEQSSVPELYQQTFTDEIPTRNLLLSIKSTVGDQWEWQPLNPTFGQTPHATCVQVETARAQDYFSGPPDFSAEFSQSSFEWALEHGAVAALLGAWKPRGDLRNALDYATARLAWNPYQSVRSVVADWVAASIGIEIADRVADLLLDLDDIYRNGFHVRGQAYNTWEPLLHVRKGWVCKGNRYLDGGKGHHRFLRDRYLLAKPEIEYAIETMSVHVDRYDAWLKSYREWMKELPKPEVGQWLELVLDRGQASLHLNLAYVTAFLRYFDYEDGGDAEHARDALSALEAEVSAFRARTWEDASKYILDSFANLQGIEELLRFGARGLDDRDGTKQAMLRAPDEKVILDILAEGRKTDTGLIESAGKDADVVATWTGLVDGRDVLDIDFASEEHSIEHCLGDFIRESVCVFHDVEIPPDECRIAIRHVRGHERGYAYILEQPGDLNGTTLRLLLEDLVNGYGAYEVEMLLVPRGT